MRFGMSGIMSLSSIISVFQGAECLDGLLHREHDAHFIVLLLADVLGVARGQLVGHLHLYNRLSSMMHGPNLSFLAGGCSPVTNCW